MLRYTFLLSFFAICLFMNETNAQREFEVTIEGETYQMKEYFVVFLKRGPLRDSLPKEQAEELQPKHLAYLGNLAQEGKIILNGPFGDNGDLRGMSFYNVESKEEALRLASEDPMVKAGWLAVEVHPWFGAKGTVLK